MTPRKTSRGVQQNRRLPRDLGAYLAIGREFREGKGARRYDSEVCGRKRQMFGVNDSYGDTS